MQGGDLARSDETQAALLVRHAVQEFQMSFTKKPEPVPLPETPEWGYLEIEQEKTDTSTRRAKRFQEKLARKRGTK